VRGIAAGIAVALLAALAYQALGAAVFGPGLTSDDPREVVTAYFGAQRWGYRALAERVLSDEERAARNAPGYVRPLVPDEFLARDLVVSEPADIALHGEYAEETQFTVTYRSLWRSSVGDPPGARLWFVYVGRDGNGDWRVLSEGTGP
jgi:hypothetical protein